MSQFIFPFIEQADEAAQQARLDAHTVDHISSMRLCWPEWEGPRVEDSLHGRCEVGRCIVFNLTHSRNTYHYMAPCRIESVSEDGLTVIAVIDYNPDCHCSKANGERVRLHITEVWPPVQRLISLRNAA